jgi:hypothetical protein
MRTRKFEIAFFLFVCVLAITALTCNGDGPEEVSCPEGESARTEGCDQLKRRLSKVYKGPSNVANLATATYEFTLSGWRSVNTGDAVTTNASGEAELNFSDCYPGHIYCFKDSGLVFRAETCRKTQYPSHSTCADKGTLFVGDCAAEFTVDTANARLTVQGTSFAVTYVPGGGGVTLVVGLEGSVNMLPVDSVEPIRFGESIDVPGGQFLFTMLETELVDIAGFAPRQRHGLEDLPIVADELGIQDWMLDVRVKAEEIGVLPDNWPPRLGGEGGEGEGIRVTSGGAFLDDPLAQEAVATAVDWFAVQNVVAPGGGQVLVNIGDDYVDALSLEYDPERAVALLEEGGYPLDLPIMILFPAEDERLGEAAGVIAEYLSGLGMEIGIEPVPASELDAVTSTLAAAGEAFMVVTR